MPRAMSFAVPFSLPSSASAKPRRKCASIIPEFPRAPRTAPRAAVRAVLSRGASPRARRASETERRVRLKLVPVSPSGTGKTLIRLISSRPAVTQSEAASSERDSLGPSTYAIPTLIGLDSLSLDGDVNLGVHVGVEPDGGDVSADRLDRLGQLDLSAVYGKTLGRERVGDVLGGDRSEEPPFLAGFAGQYHLGPSQAAGERLGLATLGYTARVTGLRFGRDALAVALARLIGQALGKQEISSVTGLYLHQLAGPAERLYILTQNHFHDTTLLRRRE